MSAAFDHLMVLVPDEAAAAQEFAAAGFTVTPRSELPGMANRLVCFPSSVSHAASFIELLSVEQADAVPAAIQSLIGQTLGPIALVFAVPDLSTCLRAFSEAGVAITGPLKIRRRWALLPSGQTLDVALDVVLGDETVLPFKWAIVQHHTVEHYQRAEFVSHANGCRAIRAIVASVDDPLREAMRVERVLGCGYRRIGEATVVDLQHVQLVLTPAASPRESPIGCAVVGLVMQGGSADIDIDDLARKFSQRGYADTIDTVELSRLKLF